MEGPLVSDTTEVLSGAAPASEEPSHRAPGRLRWRPAVNGP